MSRHCLLQSRSRILALALASFTLAGCASSMKTAADSAPDAVIAGSAGNAGFWGRFKSWMPKWNTNIPDAQEIENPGKLHLAYATWQEKLGNLVEARESYELALGDNPKSVDAIIGLARLDQLNQRNLDAEQRFLKAMKLKPNDPNVLDAVGQFYASQERWEKSIDMLSRAVQIDPRDTSYRFNLAVALARSGRIEEAMPHFSQTVGDAEAHYNVGYILYQQHDAVGAERHLLQAVVARPDLKQAQQMLDEVRSNQADRSMFANRQSPAGRRAGTAQRQVATRTAGVASVGNVQTGHPSSPKSSNVIPASSQQDYRREYQPARQPATDFSSAGRPQTTQPFGTASPSPWHTSDQYAQPQSQVRPSVNNPPGISQPTAEQLEQWRNQLNPTTGGP